MSHSSLKRYLHLIKSIISIKRTELELGVNAKLTNNIKGLCSDG